MNGQLTRVMGGDSRNPYDHYIHTLAIDCNNILILSPHFRIYSDTTTEIFLWTYSKPTKFLKPRSMEKWAN